MRIYILYRGVRYAHDFEMEEKTKVSPFVTMQDVVALEYLDKIEEVNKRLRFFGWSIYPAETTKRHEGRRVIVMRLEDRMKHSYMDLSDALHALSLRIKDRKFHDLVLPAN